MRHVRMSFVLALVMLASLGLAGPRGTKAAPAAAIPGGPFATAFRVQNLDPTQNAQCTYELFDEAGQSRFTSPPLPAIRPNESAYVYTPQVAGLPAGTFAAVITCNVQVAAVVNFSDATKGDTYLGISNPAPTLYVPSAYNNYFNYFTQYRIQNASDQRQTVRVDYFAPGSGTPAASTTHDVAGRGVVTVEQNAVAQLQRNVSYSARITGSQNLAATVSIYGQGSVGNQLYAFSAFAGGTTGDIYAPVIMRNYYGYNTATTIQNLGGSQADVDVVYSSGTTRNYKIPANSSVVVLDFNEQSLRPNVLYSAVIRSKNSQPLIVTVNESTPTTNRASTYEGLSGAQSGRTQVAPIVMYRYFGYNSSISCQNVGAADTQVSISYAGTDGQGRAYNGTGASITIPAGQVRLFYQPDPGQRLPTGFIGSATLTSASSNIVCVANQDQNEAPQSTQNVDQLYAYGTLLRP